MRLLHLDRPLLVKHRHGQRSLPVGLLLATLLFPRFLGHCDGRGRLQRAVRLDRHAQRGRGIRKLQFVGIIIFILILALLLLAYYIRPVHVQRRDILGARLQQVRVEGEERIQRVVSAPDLKPVRTIYPSHSHPDSTVVGMLTHLCSDQVLRIITVQHAHVQQTQASTHSHELARDRPDTVLVMITALVAHAQRVQRAVQNARPVPLAQEPHAVAVLEAFAGEAQNVTHCLHMRVEHNVTRVAGVQRVFLRLVAMIMIMDH